MDVYLDLWGTLLDGATMHAGYRARVAEILRSRFDLPEEVALRAHDEAYAEYAAWGEDLDWIRGDYQALVDDLDARHGLALLRRAGVAWRPDDPLRFSRDLEREIMASVDARFPDARSAVERLRAAGHRAFVVTTATESNARGSLAGAGLLEAFDGIFTGEALRAHKRNPAYWRALVAATGGPIGTRAVVDDRLEYLEPASSVGITALLLDRREKVPADALPSYVRGVLRNLAGLPHYVEVLAGGGPP